MASNFYRAKDEPRYILGHALELSFISAGIIAALVLVLSYSAINKKRDRRMAEEGGGEGGGGGGGVLSNVELSEMGDKAYTFRYMY